jgi:hypothetical protein
MPLDGEDGSPVVLAVPPPVVPEVSLKNEDPEFAVERWMDRYENACRYNLSETCVESLTVAGLLRLAGREGSLEEALSGLKLTYGSIPGSDLLRGRIGSLYTRQTADNVIVTHGAIGANALVYQALVEPGDRVVSVLPTYQQHTSIPESLGAEVLTLRLEEGNGFLPDLDDLRKLVGGRAKLIAFSNPNNPTGSLMDWGVLQNIVSIAREAGAWILGDEVYRGIDQAGDGFTASVADLYERGISTGKHVEGLVSSPVSGWDGSPRRPSCCTWSRPIATTTPSASACSTTGSPRWPSRRVTRSSRETGRSCEATSPSSTSG